ncbi:MAG: hypothetical protein WA895_39680, partial [Streptosporangiaceae bacterium]
MAIREADDRLPSWQAMDSGRLLLLAAVATGAASLPPCCRSLSSSPMAMTEPNAIAVCGSVTRAAAVCATAATTIIPPAARSSSRPESMACHDGSRSSASRIATGSSCG